MSRVAYMRAWPRDPATGAVGLVAMAGGGSHMPYWRDNLHYRAGLVREPRFASALGFDDKGWTGGALPTVSTIEFAPSDPALLGDFSALYWKDAAIEIDAGEEYAGVGRILTGTIGEVAVRNGRLMITVADFGVKLGKPAIQSWFAGTGGIEGDAVADGRVKRRSYGYCANVEGRVLLAAHNIYEFGDPTRPSNAIPIIRHMGRQGFRQPLEWQGSAAATLDALIASTPPQGGGVVAASINCVKWWTDPTGAPLTADIQGDNGGGYVETPAAIAARLLSHANGPAIVNLAEAVALRNMAAGLHIGDDSETTTAALDRLLLPVSLFWRFGTTGQIDIRPWSWDGDAEVLQGRFIGRVRTSAPHRTRRLGYNRNHRLHSEGEIAADILAGDVTFGDGTTLDDLKEQADQDSDKLEGIQPGANVTGDHTAADTLKVSGRPVEQVLSDLDLNGQNWFEMAMLESARDALMLARTSLDGQLIGTVVTTFKQEQIAQNIATAETFDLLGAKSGDGSGFILNLGTVKVAPNQSFAQYLSTVEANLGAVTGAVNDLRSVVITPEGDVLVKVVFAQNANGHVVGSVATNDGTIGDLTFVYDRFRLLKPDGTLMFGYDETSDIVTLPNVRVDTLEIGAMDYEFNLKKTITPTQVSQEIPGGLIMKTGRFSALIGDETSMSIVFDEPFPNECLSFMPVGKINAASNYRDLWVQIVGDPTRFGATIQTQSSTSNNNNIDGFHWQAWGT